MKSDGLLKPVLVAAAVAVLVYAISFTAIERRRTRRGPWQVTFTNDPPGTPLLLINQPALGITNIQIRFSHAALPTNFVSKTLAFDQPQPVPFPVPLGRCLFLDTTFLPGTVVLDVFDHEIQLIPRVLTIDRHEQPWRSDTVIPLGAATNTAH